MSLDLCLKQLHVVHIKVFHRMQYYTFALVLLSHFPVRHFPANSIPLRFRLSFSTPANSSHPLAVAAKSRQTLLSNLNRGHPRAAKLTKFAYDRSWKGLRLKALPKT